MLFWACVSYFCFALSSFTCIAHIAEDVENYILDKPLLPTYGVMKEYPNVVKGKDVVSQLESQLKEKIKILQANGIQPFLHVIAVAPNAASLRFLEKKKKACAEFGMTMHTTLFLEDVSQEDLLKKIKELNSNSKVHGIMLYLPLPSHLDTQALLDSIDPGKDVDGLTTFNQGKLMEGKPFIVPSTALGCLLLLRELSSSLEGKNVLILGRSNLVGKPLAHLLLGQNCTVTIAHSKTKMSKELAQRADILVSATGVPLLVKESWIKEGAIILDVGISFPDGRTPTGDVDLESVERKAVHITPVPEGMGPLTVFMTLVNLVKTASKTN
ncbi:MAG: bifunctional 5,10-methylenetetrahydrofolate dehydrogenase/5,10-methenyltetrahydrofolate cyclohydrolase [Alphaproteobacteria bacterium]|nr:bifunctional 5,10-methylenetetrahydrofolate dehydrogenase/5,10-methenyltetrahydrofolate cyclohydrolase [Alphaproteobacteria bacterium]